ncbi:uncharacterized protein MYCFIDRAFT_211710 [Pseudocercospora fijiensis CIRAD86]|uniref:Uncharacterized protein n=1 Tax=Pseudocercospora fijiensis (strain CIRAD86) TaxID=383855 RepID=M2ZPC7_PSEFD|nr:uncharacterized protein MYCFIDRAFT_211710 [Pseudocercospora fijiensis CIRAD86]EME80954.1 hypothetical protein MYCFIDRAFT_211710 [Pseudocercospora fijiensis CIRAD86]
MSVPGAFDEAFQGVKYIIHIASPISTKADDADTDLEKAFVTAAIDMTRELFKSAGKADTVKRIVVTSSAGAIVPMSAFFEPTNTPFSAELRQPELPGPHDNAMSAYLASKIAALNRAEEWVTEHKPNFDVIQVHPSFILGRDDLCKTKETFQTGTNRLVLNHALGVTDSQVPVRPPTFNSVHDCAMVHVKALDPSVAGNQSFIVSSAGGDGFEWNQANEIILKTFPDAVKNGVLPNNGFTATLPCLLDVAKTEQTFNFRHSAFEPLVAEVVGHYLEVLETEKKASEKA